MNSKNFLTLGKKLWPLNRSITGNGVNQTLKILKSYNNKLKIIKFKSGKKFLTGLFQMNGKFMKLGLKMKMEKNNKF